jgi:hypothetical protein
MGIVIPKFRDNLSIKGTNRLPRNVKNYHYTLRKIPEECRSHLHGSGSMKLHKGDSNSTILVGVRLESGV